MSSQQQQFSVVYDTGYDVSKDGYTKAPDSFHANGLWAVDLTCSHYQQLVDRNWRRSGKYLYKPHPEKCLSLQYTIRLDVHKFMPSQSHKNLIQRVAAYLQDGVMPAAAADTKEEQDGAKKKKKQKVVEQSRSHVASHTLQSQFAREIFVTLKDRLNIDVLSGEDQVHVIPPVQQHKKTKVGDLFCSVGMQVFGHLKKLKSDKFASPGQLTQRIVDELKQNDQITQYITSIEASNNGFINFYLNESGKLRLQNELSEQQTAQTSDAKNDSGRSRSRSASSSSHDDQKESKKAKKEPAHRLELSLHPAAFNQEAFELYRKYQVAVHKDEYDEVTEKSYIGFLVDSPIKMERTGAECSSFPMEDAIPGLEGLASMTFSGFSGYGSYHVHYCLDGKLFMVGVVDLLPSCLSSVYLYYDPDMMFLKPGVYSALAEILYVKLLSRRLPNLHYYYMGFYIHTCKKMRYKAGYKPSDLLCPVTYTWVPISQCIDQVNQDNDHTKVRPEERKLRLAPDNVPAESVDVTNVDDVVCVIERSLATVQTIRKAQIDIPQSELDKIATYKRLVGSTLCTQIARILNLANEEEEEAE